MKITGRHGAIILMYHSVTNKYNGAYIDQRYAINNKLFERQMRYLACHRYVISMDELINMLTKGETPKRGTVVITFDDGYLDNFKLAAPILKKYNLPATIYLATSYISKEEPQWIDKLYSMFRTRKRNILTLEKNRASVKYDLTNKRQLKEAYSLLVSYFINYNMDERASLFLNIKKQLDTNIELPRLTLNWDDIRIMKDKYPNIQFGAHTHEHVNLINIKESDVSEEVKKSRDNIKMQLDNYPKHFSYPYGKSNPKVKKIIEELGFKSAVITDPAALIDSSTNLYFLTRLNAPQSMLLFKTLTAGVAIPSLSRKLSCNI